MPGALIGKTIMRAARVSHWSAVGLTFCLRRILTTVVESLTAEAGKGVSLIINRWRHIIV